MCIDFVVNFDRLFLTMRFMLCPFISQLDLKLEFCCGFFNFFVNLDASVHFLIYWFISFMFQCSYRWTCTRTLCMCWCTTAGFFGNFVMKNPNEMLVQTSYFAHAGRIHYISFTICIHCIVIIPQLDVVMTAANSVSAEIMMSFAIRIVACSLWLSIKAPCNNIKVTFVSLNACSMETSVNCSGTNSCSMGNNTPMHFSLYVIPKKKLTAKVWEILDLIPTSRSPICKTNEMKTWILVTFLLLFLILWIQEF